MKTKITTQSLKELKENPELIYIKPNIGDWIPKTRIPKRCLYCKTILSYSRNEDYTSVGETVSHNTLYKYGVCSEWCLEFTNKSYLNKKFHKCKYCENPTLPILTTKEYKLKSGYIKAIGTKTGWKTICPICKLKYKEIRKHNHNVRVVPEKTKTEEEILQGLLDGLVYQKGELI